MRGAPARDAVHPARARQAPAHQADPGPARPPRRHRRARDAHPAAARRDRDRARRPDAGRARSPSRCRRRSRASTRPTTSPRSRHPRSDPSPPPRRAAAADRPAADDSAQGAPPAVAMTVDLAPYLDAVPAGRRRPPAGRPARARGQPREPRRGHARRDARRRPPGRGARRPRRRRSARTRSRRCTTSCAGVERFRTDPDPDAPLRPRWSSPTAARSSGSARSRARHADLFERLPRVIIDHHASNDAGGRRRLDRPGGRRDLRDGRPCSRLASASASTSATARSRRR